MNLGSVVVLMYLLLFWVFIVNEIYLSGLVYFYIVRFVFFCYKVYENCLILGGSRVWNDRYCGNIYSSLLFRNENLNFFLDFFVDSCK